MVSPFLSIGGPDPPTQLFLALGGRIKCAHGELGKHPPHSSCLRRQASRFWAEAGFLLLPAREGGGGNDEVMGPWTTLPRTFIQL
jgi:hypothetical protein